MADDGLNPKLLIRIQEELDELEVIAVVFHEAQNHVDRVVDNLLSNDQ